MNECKPLALGLCPRAAGGSWGHYKTLSVDEAASENDIGKAFRRLSLAGAYTRPPFQLNISTLRGMRWLASV